MFQAAKNSATVAPCYTDTYIQCTIQLAFDIALLPLRPEVHSHALAAQMQ